MPDPNIDTSILLRGVIAMMRREQVAPTRTRVMKYLYLADLHYARYAEGRTLTGWEWRVDAFGPLAVPALHLFDQGTSEGWLRTWDAGADEDDGTKRAVGYDVVGDLDAMLKALPGSIVGKLREWIKTYGGSTNRLLRFVYGNTEPMEGAHEGDVLDFSRARIPGAGHVLPATTISTKQRKSMDELMRRIRADYDATRTASAKLVDGPYDDEFRRGVPADDELTAGEVELRFPRRGD